MELEEIKVKFTQKIEKFLNRIKINQVVGFAPVNINGKPWTEKKGDAHLKASSYNRLPVVNAFFLNDHTNPAIKLHSHEYDALRKSLRKCAQFLTDEIVQYCKHGENQYELNELIKNSILLIDDNIYQMNYKSWLKEVSKNKPNDTFYVLYGTKKVCKRIGYMDLTSHCWPLVEYEFGFREILLYRLKNYLVDIYSQYLLLPSISVNPKIAYTCTQTDICELIMAIGNTAEIADSEKLKAILIEMFGVSSIYSRTCHDILKRGLGKGAFLRKLADGLDGMPTPRKRTKSSKQ